MECAFAKTNFSKLFICCCILVLPISCFAQLQKAQVKQQVPDPVGGLKFISKYIFPFNATFRHTTVGGLSGIDYDAASGNYYMICDDRSDIDPARFYTMHIVLSAKGIDSVNVKSVHTLLQKDGATYPAITNHATRTTDPEAMRYNPLSGRLIWTSEGDRLLTAKDTVVIDPTINIVDTTGKYTDTIPLPQNLRMHLTESGPRRNGVLEGLTFADNFKHLYVSLEQPLFQDGPLAALVRNNAWVRIYQFDLRRKKNIAQFAYELEPVAFPSPIPGGAVDNGISDILWVGEQQLLVTERSFSTGRRGSNIKIFLADLKNADNVRRVKSLIARPPVHPATKKLLVNMDDLGIYIDNIEGVTFGPLLPNGHRSLIFAADNNFNAKEEAQFLLFEVLP
jgi:hypothetical protein